MTYRISVVTGNRLGASTRAEIKIVLIGQNGRSDELYLEKSRLHKVPFQKGQVCIVEFIDGMHPVCLT